MRKIVHRFYLDVSKRSTECIYCGESATDGDHVMPVSKFSFAYTDGMFVVPCCTDCNNTCKARMFTCVLEKQFYIKNRIKDKYPVELKSMEPSWPLAKIRDRQLKRLNAPRADLVLKYLIESGLGSYFAQQYVETVSTQKQ